jgi:hypothetical protein
VASVLAAVVMLGGCNGIPLPMTYTQDELKAMCERQGGWWHKDELMGGYCEYRG